VRKPIVVLISMALGLASGFAAFHYAARKARTSHPRETGGRDFDPDF
jgi:hypothetical protein